MKRILILCMVFVFALSGLASAEIESGLDKFTNNKEYFTIYEAGYKESVGFTKIIDTTPLCKITFSKNVPDENRYTGKYAEIKIDNGLVENLEIVENTSMKTGIYKSSGDFIWCKALVPQDTVNRLLNAKRVALKVYLEKSPADIYVLPDSVLAEWKEVIATEE